VAKEKNLYDKAIMFMQEANKWVLLFLRILPNMACSACQ
jgi:hypothetical protein